MTTTVSTRPDNSFDQILAAGAQDLLGAGHVKQVLDGFTLSSGVPLMHRLERAYGVSGGRGVALRIGRMVFQKILKQYGESSGLTSVQFRLLPARSRLNRGLELLATIYSDLLGDAVRIEDTGYAWIWQSENCPFCRDYTTEDPCCYLMVGVLQEFLAWAGGGRFYRVSEIECRAAGGHSCTYRIEQRPVD